MPCELIHANGQRLEDIVQHHAEKLRRRLLPVYKMSRAQGSQTPRLEAV